MLKFPTLRRGLKLEIWLCRAICPLRGFQEFRVHHICNPRALNRSEFAPGSASCSSLMCTWEQIHLGHHMVAGFGLSAENRQNIM